MPDGATPRLTFPVVYHADYDLNLGDHVFPSVKYRLIHERALADGVITAADVITPEPASDDDLRLVHTADWVERLKTLQLTEVEVMKLEIPVSPELVRALWLGCGGSILAAHRAMSDGLAYNIGGGFHHAFPGHGEGFCGLHDVAVAVRKLQKEKLIERAMIVDVDVHHGNGTAAVFAGDPGVFTLSIHQWRNYPAEKPPSDIDIHLEDGTKDEEYLERLSSALLPALDAFSPDLIFYVAGSDPYIHDRLGGLWLSVAGLLARDRLVLGEARKRNIPVAITLAGGYAEKVSDTVRIHLNTLIAARDAMAG